MSMGNPPPRAVSLPKLGRLEKKVSSGRILSDAELRVLRKQAPLIAVSGAAGPDALQSLPPLAAPVSRAYRVPAQIKPSPNAFNEGFRQRIATERHIAGTDRQDLVLGRGNREDVRTNDAMLAFICDRGELAVFGGHDSAAQGTLRAAPKGEVAIDCRHPMLVEHDRALGKEKYFGRQKNPFYTDEPVKSMLGAPQVDKEASKAKIRELKRQLREERGARRSLERSASEAGLHLGGRPGHDEYHRQGYSREKEPPGVEPLPEGWFMTRNAMGERVWRHIKTQHTVSRRPTAHTATEPEHEAGPVQRTMPHGWFETRGADGRAVWRNLHTTETSRVRPSAGGQAHYATEAAERSSVWIPGRDAPKPTRASMVGRELQARRERADAPSASHTTSAHHQQQHHRTRPHGKAASRARRHG